MDKSILKKFAIESRQDLMKKIEVKLKTFYVDEEFSKEQKNDIYVLTNDKHSLNLTDEQYKKRELLVKRIKDLSLEQVIEEAAYTWFNRIIAIRYMELNDMLPLTKSNSSLGIRVLSSKDNKPDPEILKFTNLANPDLDINFNKEQYSRLKEEEKYEYVLMLVCKKLGRVIPQVFDGITDYIDILIPDNLLSEAGFINKIVTEVREDNFNQVEVIGWLYQYYNQTEKDRVMSEKKAYLKNEIPYVTQLFTPDWIVKYMVENSLGRYWLEHTTNQSIKKNWKYYIDLKLENKGNIQPTEITFIDPCSGSGHILVYAFEVLYQIYQSAGYNKSDISELILKNNIYGLDIDDRAGQLSILSILLKAREYDKNIFNKIVVSNLNILSIQESVNVQDYSIDSVPDSIKEKAVYLKEIFTIAKDIGSLLLVKKDDYTDLIKYINKEITLDTYNLREHLVPLIKQAELLSKKYDVVVTNPPYLNSGSMNSNIKEYLGKYYKNSKSDLCVAFMEKDFLVDDGYYGIINMNAWMFLTSFENFRREFVKNKHIASMVHLGARAFEDLTGEVVQTCALVFEKKPRLQDTVFVRLVDYKEANLKEKKYLESLNEKNDTYIKNQNEFLKLPNCSIAYWISQNIFKSFDNEKLVRKAKCKSGIMTGFDKKFVKFWFEPQINNINLQCSNAKYEHTTEKWFPINGGGFRKWYGNLDLVVNIKNQGEDIKKEKGINFRLRDQELYFREGVVWSEICTGMFSARYCRDTTLFFVTAPIAIPNFGIDNNYLLALLNCSVSNYIFNVINPTLHYNIGCVESLPFISNDNEKITSLSSENISISKTDWDSFETSWDFNKHPLLEAATISISNIKEEEKNGFLLENNLEEAYKNWEDICEQRFNKLKDNEEKLNEIFINIYGLQNELSPIVDDKDITVKKADRSRDIKSLISYAVGCMFGRYSLDEDGLVYAGGNFDNTKYKTYKVDIDNVIPITDESYFADDIVSRFKNFIETVYGIGPINENMDFIAETLGKKGTETSEETIRRYFNNDFYNDHLKVYQKKPIYWLFDSGKKNGFKCLTYMHRYNDGLVAKVRLDYLHRIQTTYERLLNDVSNRLSNEDLDLNTKKELQKQQLDLNNKLQETIEYDEKIAHIANQRINIDLDDGVTTNYSKFVYTNPKTNKSESILGKI